MLYRGCGVVPDKFRSHFCVLFSALVPLRPGIDIPPLVPVFRMRNTRSNTSHTTSRTSTYFGLVSLYRHLYYLYSIPQCVVPNRISSAHYLLHQYSISRYRYTAACTISSCAQCRVLRPLPPAPVLHRPGIDIPPPVLYPRVRSVGYLVSLGFLSSAELHQTDSFTTAFRVCNHSFCAIFSVRLLMSTSLG